MLEYPWNSESSPNIISIPWSIFVVANRLIKEHIPLTEMESSDCFLISVTSVKSHDPLAGF